MNSALSLIVFTEDASRAEEARRLAEQWGARWSEGAPPAFDGLCFVLTNDGCELRTGEQPDRGGVRPVFDEQAFARAVRDNPLARALGREVNTVIDATAGWGADAFTLAVLGYDVTAIERNPILFALLDDAWRRATGSELIRLRFVHAEACEWLQSLREPPDAVVIDPMFPPKKRATALAKKPMQLLRRLVGDDPDAAELLRIARSVARDRVVVKRSDDGPPLGESPAFSIETKLVRFDVYRPA